MQTIKPAPTQLFCEIPEVEEKLASGLYVPTNAQEKPKTAIVINRGEKVENYQSGDEVIYRSYAVTSIRLNNKEYLLLDEKDVLGTVLDVEEN